MENSRKMQTWWDIYRCLHKNGRMRIGEICRKIKYTGRGKNRDTISKYLHEAFETDIITKPQLTLANHEESTLYTYLLSCPSKRIEFFEKLKKHPDVFYIVLLDGDFQIFFTSYSSEISMPCRYMVSPIFTPLYTIPEGWSCSEQQCLMTILSHSYEKGILPRPVYEKLDWEPLDWQIYDMLKMDLRQSLTKIARILNISYETIRLHLYKKILPRTIQSVGFFPKGLQNYSHLLFLVKTPCEKRFVSALSKLQTSCLVWPLENHLLCMVYFQHLNLFLSVMFNLERKGVFEEYNFLLPLKYEFPDQV